MAKEWKPRRVTSEDERGGGSSDYISLDEGEKMLGHALFEADPSVDEPGYYEYMEHWINGIRKSVPCAGEDCPLCAEGERPKTRAKTLWLLVTDNKGTKLDPPQLRIFNFNYNLIKQFTELRGEDEKIKGRQFRISKVDDRGNYAVIPKAETLKVAEVKEWLKNPAAPDFDQLVTSQLRKGMEGFVTARAMEDDEPEEAAAPSTTKGAASKGAAAKSAPAKTKKKDWPAEAEDLVVTVDEVDPANTMLVSADEYDGQVKVWGTDKLDLTEIDDGATVKLDWITDADDDYVATSCAVIGADEPEEAVADVDAPDAAVLPDKIVGEDFTVVSVDASNSTIEVKSDELTLEFTLYFLDTMQVDFDDYEDGTTIVVTAEKDADGDMVATAVPTTKKATGTKVKKG